MQTDPSAGSCICCRVVSASAVAGISSQTVRRGKSATDVVTASLCSDDRAGVLVGMPRVGNVRA